MGKLSKNELPLPFGLKGIRVIGITESHGSLIIRVEKDIDFGLCPHCGILSQKVNDRHVHEVVDRPVFKPGMSLEIMKRRWKCINDFCSAVTFTEEVEGLPRGSNHTVLFQEYLYQLSRRMTLSAVKRHLAEAHRCQVSVSSIYRVVQNHLTERIDLPVNVEAEYIGLDEFSKGKGHDYGVVLVNLVERKVIDVAPGGKTKKAAKEVLTKIIPQRVKACAIDMWEPFYNACREVIPQAVVVIDCFHVVKTVNEALDRVRKRVRAHLKSKEKKEALFKYRNLFWLGTEALTEKQKHRLWDILSWDEGLGRAYELKEILRAIYAGEDAEQARRELEKWFREAQASGIKEMIEASQTLINWKEQIFNFWKYRICNAITEGKINKIKALRRQAFNYNNFQNLRLKILEQEEVIPSSSQKRAYKKS